MLSKLLAFSHTLGRDESDARQRHPPAALPGHLKTVASSSRILRSGQSGPPVVSSGDSQYP
jgi:hypothetical protein